MLAVEQLTTDYGAVRAVDGVTLEVGEGSVTAVLGANGAGKTTLLRTITGLVSPSSGNIVLDGKRINGRSVEDIVRRGLAHVPEGRGVIAELTVEENLRLGLAGRRTRGDVAAIYQSVFELFPVVHEMRKRQAGLLSGGQQQQLAIARALVAEPDVLLLDEPSLGLAPSVVDVVFRALEAIRERAIAVLLVEQRAQRTVALADRSHVLANGELRLTLGPEQANDTDTLVQAYFS